MGLVLEVKRARSFLWVVAAANAWVGCSSSSPSDSSPPPVDAGHDVHSVSADAAAKDAAPPPRLKWAACDTSTWPDGYPIPPSGLECTKIDVPLDYNDPKNGKTFTLNVGRVLSNAHPSTGKAVFALAGGPGGSAVWESGVLPMVFPGLFDTFDVIYVDQRGTGGSNYLNCTNAGGNPVTVQDWTTCAAENNVYPLNDYLTAEMAEDIDSVRVRLGYSKMYIRGGSYGTRVGLEYARRFPENLAAAVLDGVLPPDVDIFSQEETATDTDVNGLVAACAASPACLAVSPNLLSDLEARKATLAASPRSITIGGQPYEEDVQAFDEELFGACDWTGTYYSIPQAIHASVGGDDTPWNEVLTNVYGTTVTGDSDPAPHPHARRAARIRTIAPRRNPVWKGLSYVAIGTYETVTCAEYKPNTSIPALEALVPEQNWQYPADGTDTVWQLQACSSWDVSPVAASERQPVTSPARILLMNGAIDDRTPAAWGAHAKETLPNATNVLIPYASHEAGTVFPCPADMTVQYLVNDGDYSKVDSSCIQAITQPPW